MSTRDPNELRALTGVMMDQTDEARPRRGGRQKMLRITADRIEGIVCAATEAKDEGSTVAEVLEELAPLLRKARCDDREKVLRRITNLFGVSGVARTAAFVMFGLSPREKAPSKKAPRKSGSSISDAARARLAELAARPRRACAYGAGTRGSPLGKSR